jgi:hypothetical protein
MLVAIKSKKLITKYQNEFETILSKYLKKEGDYALGHQGDNFEHNVKFNDKIWWSSFDIDDSETSPRFWNGFGLLPFKNTGTQDIVVEINIPHEGINGRVSGIFAKDPITNDVFILHRGRIGGGRKGVGKDSFKEWYRGSWVQVSEDNKKSCEAILITSIHSKKAISNIYNFVSQVKQFKDEVTGNSLSRQIKQEVPSGSPLTFDPEFSGSKKGKRKSTRFRQECNHGIIVNALEKWARKKNRKKGKIQTFNTQLIDLGLQINDTLSEIYEVKTNFDRQSIYTGIGQLFFHSIDNPETIKNLVLPRINDNKVFRNIFKGLNVNIVLYEIDSEMKVSFYE